MTDPAADTQREMLSLLTARVRDAYVQAPFYVDADADLRAACRALVAGRRSGALVRDRNDQGQERLGIFTTTDLRDALARDVLPATVREVTRFDLIEIGPQADLFEALWLMLRHRVHRLLVRETDGTILGLLAQSDLVGFVANHSHIVALQIDAAGTTAELAAAAQRIDAMVALLHDGGIKIERIARVVAELNRRLVARAWSQIAPPEWVANSCLVVMGSEGRGEQILKTDQDNALVLRDGFAIDASALEAAAARLSAAMSDFGWPPCPGGIMLSNPAWRDSVSGFRAKLRDWVHGPDPEGPMHLAIFFDAAPLAGDAALLDELRAHLERVVSGSDAFLARFAAAADQFDEPASWWSRWVGGSSDEQALDLKKLGTFPIVHGVRALCLAHRVGAPDTTQRIERLVQANALDAALGRDLVEALHYLMGLKLRLRLTDNRVRPSDLSTMDRDQLKDALAIVKRLRALLRQRFRLDAL